MLICCFITIFCFSNRWNSAVNHFGTDWLENYVDFRDVICLFGSRPR